MTSKKIQKNDRRRFLMLPSACCRQASSSVLAALSKALRVAEGVEARSGVSGCVKKSQMEERGSVVVHENEYRRRVSHLFQVVLLTFAFPYSHCNQLPINPEQDKR
jgi:hypothetical protein